MAITWFEDIDDLVSAVQGTQITEEALDYIVGDIQRILIKHIDKDIYEAYTPKEGAWVGGSTYERRYVLYSGIKSTLEPDGTLVTTSEEPAGHPIIEGYRFSNEDSGFLRLLESGHMGIWKHGFPRPAVTNAQKEVDSSPIVRRNIEYALEKTVNT